MRLSEAEKIMQGTLKGKDAHFYGASSDTRLLRPGELFFAWQGEHFDAHNFLSQAANKGAIAAIVERYQPKENIRQIVVKNSMEALATLAKAWREQWQASGKKLIIALTGSNGKTTLKEMTKTILAQNHVVLATEGNFNNHVGCPLTLLKLNEKHEIAIIELGANHPGEIDYLTHLVQPDMAIINNAGPCHLEGFGTLQGVAEAKAEIFHGLSSKGIAIINGEDAFSSYWLEVTEKYHRVVFKNRVTDASEEILTPPPGGEEGYQQVGYKTLDKGEGTNGFTLYCPTVYGQHTAGQKKASETRASEKEDSIDIYLKLAGQHNILNAVAAATLSLLAGVSLKKIKKGLEAFNPVVGRLEPILYQKNIVLINDAYNANPNSLKVGIDSLKAINRWLVLGDMKELGPQEREYHQKAGYYAKENGINKLFTLGELSKATAEAFGREAYVFESKEALIKILQEELTHYGGESLEVLFKGSNSMKIFELPYRLQKVKNIKREQ